MFHFWKRAAGLTAVVAFALVGCSSTAGNGSATAPTASGTGSGASAAATAGSTIVIDNFGYMPQSLTVSPGQKVTVVNKDSTPHTLTASTGKAFDTGTIAAKSSGSFTAPTTPGSYPYICSIHQFMHATLVVK
ncbi:cupredoxin domain-containing protein [Streptacidiphilus cavernicola]|uniref:Cupredoxin domain-containing protein n=1 Tax=Streptacidiphilus cavernicola TaxID=3342716 RepID=A0ABV6VWM2_9ACTN